MAAEETSSPSSSILCRPQRLAEIHRNIASPRHLSTQRSYTPRQCLLSAPPGEQSGSAGRMWRRCKGTVASVFGPARVLWSNCPSEPRSTSSPECPPALTQVHTEATTATDGLDALKRSTTKSFDIISDSASVMQKPFESRKLTRKLWIAIIISVITFILMGVLILAMTIAIPHKIESVLYHAEMILDEVRLTNLTATGFSIEMVGTMLTSSRTMVEVSAPDGLEVMHLTLPNTADLASCPSCWIDPKVALERATSNTALGTMRLEPLKSSGTESTLKARGTFVVDFPDAFEGFCQDLVSNGKSMWLLRGRAHVSCHGLKFTSIRFLRAMSIQGLPFTTGGPKPDLQMPPAMPDDLQIRSLTLETAVSQVSKQPYLRIATVADLHNAGPTSVENLGNVTMQLMYADEPVAVVRAESLPLQLGVNALALEGFLVTDSPTLGSMMSNMVSSPALQMTVVGMPDDRLTRDILPAAVNGSSNVFAPLISSLKLSTDVKTGTEGGGSVLQAIDIVHVSVSPASEQPVQWSANDTSIPPFPNTAVRNIIERISDRRNRRRRRLQEAEPGDIDELLKFRADLDAKKRRRSARQDERRLVDNTDFAPLKGIGYLARNFLDVGAGALSGATSPALSRIGAVLQGVSASLARPTAEAREFLSINTDEADINWAVPLPELVRLMSPLLSDINLTGLVEVAVWHPFKSLGVEMVEIEGPVFVALDPNRTSWFQIGDWEATLTSTPFSSYLEAATCMDRLEIPDSARSSKRMGLVEGRVEPNRFRVDSLFRPLVNEHLIDFLREVFMSKHLYVMMPQTRLHCVVQADYLVPLRIHDDAYKHSLTLQGLGGFGEVVLTDIKVNDDEENMTIQLELTHNSESPIIVDTGPILLDWIYAGSALGPITIANLHLAPGQQVWHVHVGMYPVGASAQHLSKLVTDLMAKSDFRLCVGRRSQRSAEEDEWMNNSANPWTPFLDTLLSQLDQACLILPNPLTALSNAGLFPVMSQLAMRILRKISKSQRPTDEPAELRQVLDDSRARYRRRR